MREVPRDDPRYRIEHFSFGVADQIERAQSLGVILSAQPPFLLATGDFFESRTAEAGIVSPPIPYRSMLDRGRDRCLRLRLSLCPGPTVARALQPGVAPRARAVM